MSLLKIISTDWAGDTIIGDRASQQDVYRIADWPEAPQTKSGGLILALADGMGGHAGGAEAADVAIGHALRHVFTAPADTPIAVRLHDAVLAGNGAVGAARARHGEDHDGMGCTLVLAAIDGHGISWASVGDSPLYLIRGDALIRLNRDHSMAPTLAYMVRQGELTEAEAAEDPRRNQLRSALTGAPLPLIDSGEPTTPLKPDDKLILASDGILELPDETLIDIAHTNRSADTICRSILQRVRSEVETGLDNTSVIVYAKRKRGWF